MTKWREDLGLLEEVLVDVPPPEAAEPGPQHVSVILRSLLANSKVSRKTKRAIRLGIELHKPHQNCPCIECHRAFRTAP